MMKGLLGKIEPPKLNSGEQCGHLNLSVAIKHTAKRFPNRIAVTYKNQSMTYKELDASAVSFALSLKELGICSGYKVAILMERSEKMIVSILAILKLDCAYIPVDTDYPRDRIEFILKDSNANAIIIGDSVNYEFPSLNIISVSENIITSCKTGELQCLSHEINGARSIAYIIYTSGSTGRPKGVQVTHSNVHNYAYWFCTEFGITEADVVDFSSTLAFDLSVTSTIVPLLCGAQIQVCPQETKGLPHKYLKYIEETKVSLIKLTPSYFGQLVQLLEHEQVMLGKLTVILGGEALVPTDLKIWFSQYPRHCIINEYGPTETTVATLAYKVLAGDRCLESSSIPIGKPSYNTAIYILDEQKQICGQGEIGELCIAGESVSKGYLDRPGLNKSVFIKNPFSNSGKLYRTGDLAKLLEDGNIEFLGRVDHQIKIRGFRIEPGEIEASVLAHISVDAVVIQPFKKDSETKLIAYLKLRADAAVSVFELRQYLKKQLPEYMIPSYFIFLEKMPLTVNGKLDRSALPLPGDTVSGIDNVEPESDTEKSMLEIWRSVLNSNFGVTDDFFVLGGESINAAQIIYQIEKKFAIQLSLHDFYKYSNVRLVAKIMEKKLFAAIQEDETLVNVLAEIEAMNESEIKQQLNN